MEGAHSHIYCMDKSWLMLTPKYTACPLESLSLLSATDKKELSTCRPCREISLTRANQVRIFSVHFLVTACYTSFSLFYWTHTGSKPIPRRV
ncbi:hypothetical protein SCHPADRAFT_649010 [Schizopora paradoxa]|uniref:Uncharacterized protein n=1 Tax=Schizopora paradoxa TaxID=27342 RepID=A0A0H2R6I0_9AGAM|nr:hypothetical protein SCHPADRAFT_649010 [Schizopora paradoxa]